MTSTKIAILGFPGVMALLLSSCLSMSCLAEETRQMQAKQEKPARACGKCGMDIEQCLKTAVRVDYNDGTTEEYCGVGCSLKRISLKGGYETVKSAQVTGWATQEPMEMQEATYVTGSDLAMNMVTRIIAFESKDAAEVFIKDKGGKIESLDSLLTGALQQNKK